MAFLTRRYRDVLKIQGSSGQRYMRVRTSCILQCELYEDNSGGELCSHFTAVLVRGA